MWLVLIEIIALLKSKFYRYLQRVFFFIMRAQTSCETSPGLKASGCAEQSVHLKRPLTFWNRRTIIPTLHSDGQVFGAVKRMQRLNVYVKLSFFHSSHNYFLSLSTYKTKCNITNAFKEKLCVLFSPFVQFNVSYASLWQKAAFVCGHLKQVYIPFPLHVIIQHFVWSSLFKVYCDFE